MAVYLFVRIFGVSVPKDLAYRSIDDTFRFLEGRIRHNKNKQTILFFIFIYLKQ